MRFLGLISGGKDSIYNMKVAIDKGHVPVCLLHMKMSEEKDSFMFQYAGSSLITAIAECLSLPLHLFGTEGKSCTQTLDYTPTEDDEIEDLFKAVKSLLDIYSFEGVAVGAISSVYQYNRVNNVCNRLGLKMLGYLWGRDQFELIDEMISNEIDAVVVKGGEFLSNLVGCKLTDVKEQYGEHICKQIEKHKLLTRKDFNICGEGGEYETITLNAPIYNKKIEILQKRITDDGTGVKTLEIDQYRLVDKY